MSTLLDDVLPIIDLGRQLIDDLGFRLNTLSINVRTWAGAPGDTAAGFTDATPLVLSPNPDMHELSEREILASSGTYRQGNVRVGPITPSYGNGLGGYTPEQLRVRGGSARPSSTTGPAVETTWVITGPLAAVYQLVDMRDDEPTRYTLTLRRQNATP